MVLIIRALTLAPMLILFSWPDFLNTLSKHFLSGRFHLDGFLYLEFNASLLYSLIAFSFSIVAPRPGKLSIELETWIGTLYSSLYFGQAVEWLAVSFMALLGVSVSASSLTLAAPQRLWCWNDLAPLQAVLVHDPLPGNAENKITIPTRSYLSERGVYLCPLNTCALPEFTCWNPNLQVMVWEGAGSLGGD